MLSSAIASPVPTSCMHAPLDRLLRNACRTSDASTRCAALALMAALVEGLGADDRSAESIQSQALKSVLRTLKDFSDAATLAAGTGVLHVRQCTPSCLWCEHQHGNVLVISAYCSQKCLP